MCVGSARVRQAGRHVTSGMAPAARAHSPAQRLWCTAWACKQLIDHKRGVFSSGRDRGCNQGERHESLYVLRAPPSSHLYYHGLFPFRKWLFVHIGIELVVPSEGSARGGLWGDLLAQSLASTIPAGIILT